MNKKFEELTQQAFEQFTNGHLKESKLLLWPQNVTAQMISMWFIHLV